MENKIPYTIRKPKQFKQDYKLCKTRGLNINLLNEVIYTLVYKQSPDIKYRDHTLIGNYKGYRECHIQSDWLLIYKIIDKENLIVFTRTGSHNDLF